MLEDLNVPTFRNGKYVFLTGATGAQHLKNERDTGGFRYVTARNEGAAGNSIYRGQIGMIEGADVVVATRMPNNMGLLIGADALAKVYANSDGYGASPQTIVAPIVDKLRRFLLVGLAALRRLRTVRRSFRRAGPLRQRVASRWCRQRSVSASPPSSPATW